MPTAGSRLLEFAQESGQYLGVNDCAEPHLYFHPPE